MHKAKPRNESPETRNKNKKKDRGRINMKKIKTSRRIMAAMLTLTMLLPVNIQAKTQEKIVTTPIATLPEKSDVSQVTVNINKKNGTRTFTVFGQHKKPWKKNTYLDMHGCAVCSLTTVLSGYSKKYGKYTPDQVKNIVEKKAFGTAAWKKNYGKSMRSQMPVSMYGISKVLNHEGIRTRYVRTFTNKSARKQIKDHLKTGNVVVIEANNRTQKNGKFSRTTTTRWALGKHTMVLLGFTDTGKVIVADSAQRKWSKEQQRIKFTTVNEIVNYLIPCTSSRKSYYFSGTANSGGYVLVNLKK